MSEHSDHPWFQLLRSLLGEQGAEEALRAMRQAGMDPAALADAAALPADGPQLSSLLGQMQQLLFSHGDDDTAPVLPDVTSQVALQLTQGSDDPAVVASQDANYRQMLAVADLWLDAVTDFSPAPGRRDVLSRSQWVQRCTDGFITLATPVAKHMADAMEQVMEQRGALGGQIPEGFQQLFPTALLRKMGATGFSLQTGHALAALAKEVFGYSDIGLPLTGGGHSALIPRNIEAFADGLEQPFAEVAQFLAVREAAAARLYGAVGWLESHVQAIITTYAEHISIDMDQISSSLDQVDPTDPESIREMMASGVFAPTTTAEQQAALQRLETTLAIVEGWVDTITEAATAAHLPNTAALQEMLRRRRVAGGPAEHVCASLVGLQLRPARLREAAHLFQTIQRRDGGAARDAIFTHPDLLPTAADLDDVEAYLARRDQTPAADDDFDAGLQALLDGTLPYHDDVPGHEDDN
ncbi:MAG: zinc-dependent metalloprotease [Bowdeniella nasicola]|nr:zinc-dependent metalloprotease [Bowdeniella nasicola]